MGTCGLDADVVRGAQAQVLGLGQQLRGHGRLCHQGRQPGAGIWGAGVVYHVDLGNLLVQRRQRLLQGGCVRVVGHQHGSDIGAIGGWHGGGRMHRKSRAVQRGRGQNEA